MTALIPVTILTGFLGSGKTTLVNRLLSQNHGRRLMVLVNEFGAVGVDADLIVSDDGTVIEMANGCVCCTTQGDLRRALRDVAGRPDIEAVVIETSGLADPEPVVAEFDNGVLNKTFRLQGVISVIDADNFDRNLDQAEAAYQQIVWADVLVVNKVDLVDAGIVDQIATGLGKLNPAAPQLRSRWCDLPVDLVAGDADRPRRTGPSPDGSAGGHHHSDFVSVTARLAGPVARADLDRWIEALPTSIFRVKGFVRLQGQDGLATVHVVGARHSINPAHRNDTFARLVMIGRNAADLRQAEAALPAMVRQEGTPQT